MWCIKLSFSSSLTEVKYRRMQRKRYMIVSEASCTSQVGPDAPLRCPLPPPGSSAHSHAQGLPRTLVSSGLRRTSPRTVSTDCGRVNGVPRPFSGRGAERCPSASVSTCVPNVFRVSTCARSADRVCTGRRGAWSFGCALQCCAVTYHRPRKGARSKTALAPPRVDAPAMSRAISGLGTEFGVFLHSTAVQELESSA